MRHADRIAGAALLALAVAFGAFAWRQHAYWGPYGPGPAFLPVWLAGTMAVLASMLLVGALRSAHAGAEWLPRGEGRKRLGLVLGATIAFVALLKVLGMVVGTVLFLIILLRRLDRIAWPLTLAVALGTAGVNFLVFKHWLRVPMPVGVFGF